MVSLSCRKLELISKASFGKTAGALVVHRSQDARLAILEYDVHGKITRTGAPYDNRFISVVSLEDRKIVRWRDYMDSLAAMTALSQVSL